MNGFTENRAHGAPERPGKDEKAFTWGGAQSMLPLVGRIAGDVRRLTERLLQLQAEREQLHRLRHSLDWPRRSRRYQLDDEVRTAEAELRAAEAELERLSVSVLDGLAGLVGFPTVVNDRRAFFSWQPGESGLELWNYAGDRSRRPVPLDWTKPLKSHGRPRREKR
jgi:hypothetical protein